MDEVMHDYRTEIAQDTVLTSVIEIANDLLSLPSFDYLHRTQVLRDLIDIASADNKMLDREIEWIQTLGAIWNVKPADINRICNIRNK
jgi:uncharacterized tellurite resistance protein B-like protein